MSEPRDLQRVLTPAYDEARTAATWQRIAEARAGRRRVRRAPAWAIGLGLAATAVATVAIVMVARHDGGGRPLASMDPSVSLGEGARVDAEDRVRAVVLDDGSRVELARDTHLQVLANAGDRFVTLLEHGAAHFDVKPHGPRRWEIETALATVEVVGTSFRVEHSDTRLLVEVERGVVMVRGERVPGRVVRLVAGEHIEITAEVAANDLPAPAPAGSPAPAPSASAIPAPVAPAPSAIPAPAPSAIPAPAPSHTATRTATATAARPSPTSSPVDVALAAADRLRADGDAAGAADLLDHALADDAGSHSPGAGLAAFTLGRLALDRLGQPERAARAFARVIALGSPHGLLEDAYARRAEALIRAGDRPAAEAALAEYERAYPAGRRAPALRAQLDR